MANHPSAPSGSVSVGNVFSTNLLASPNERPKIFASTSICSLMGFGPLYPFGYLELDETSSFLHLFGRRLSAMNLPTSSARPDVSLTHCASSSESFALL